MKIRTKLMMAFSIILLLPSLAIGWTSYQTARNEIHEELLNNAEQSIRFLDQQITDLMSKKIVDMEYLAKVIRADMVDGFESPEIRTILDQFMGTHPDYEKVYYGTNQGILLRSPEDKQADPNDPNNDPREKLWYIASMQRPGQVVINDPNVSSTTGNVTVAVTRQTADGAGVVGGSIDLAYLAELNNSVKIGREGYSFIVDQNQNYLVHPTTASGVKNTQSYINELGHRPLSNTHAAEPPGKRRIRSLVKKAKTQACRELLPSKPPDY